MNVAGARLAVRHLIDLGHERIAHLSGGDNPAALGRLEGYENAMKESGLGAYVHVVPGGLTDVAGYTAAASALASKPTPTALFVANDIAALGALAAVQESGRSVPADVSVVGYDGIALGSLRTLSLTTVAQPLTAMGAQAALRLFDRIERPRQRAQHLHVESTLVVRGSTARPRRRP
jgi:DNA-binding LacI/PurR family transcriptional regulator